MRDNATRHELHLCASDREVESIDLSKKIHDLNTKLTDTNGNDYYYVGYITGQYLDTNVNSNRTAFYIDKEKSLTIDDYDDIFDKYCSGVTDLSRASLSEYVIRRKTILDLLEKALEWDDDKKYKKEEIIHSLICPMKHSSNDIPFEEMNLWIVDERLSFHNYLASDQELKSIPVIDSNSSDRIDIAIFDQALSFSIEKDHFNNITIIELKRPNRNNYSANGKDNDPIEQVLRYVKLIREGKAKLANGRGFGNVENTPFYCYIIADLTSTLIDRADTLGYTKTPDGEGYFGYNPNRNAYVEIISYTKLLDDAKKSNQVLFDKLFNPKSSEIKHHY